MYRTQLVWNGLGWEYATVFVPVNTGVYTLNTFNTGFYNGLYPYAGVSVFAPGQVVSASYAVSGR